MSRTLFLDAATLDELEAASSRRGVSLSTVLRELLSDRAISPEGEDDATKPQPAYPRAFKSLGIAASGRGDLAQRSVDEEPVPPVSSPFS